MRCDRPGARCEKDERVCSESVRRLQFDAGSLRCYLVGPYARICDGITCARNAIHINLRRNLRRVVDIIKQHLLGEATTRTHSFFHSGVCEIKYRLQNSFLIASPFPQIQS